jgi:hypothetical protein
MGYGAIAIKPLEYTNITDQEVARLWHDHKEAFWELHWQSVDAIDLFMARVNFHTKDVAAQNRIEPAVCQLTASSRQRDGMSPKSVRGIGHDLNRLFSELSWRIGSPIDSTVADVIASFPEYVDVRYDAPPMTMLNAQNLFRKAMFVIADFLRRTNHDQMYWREAETGKLPPRNLT